MNQPNAHSSPTSPGRPIAQVSFLHSTADFLFVQELAPPFSWGARYPWSKRSDVPPFAHGIRTSRIHAMVVAFHLLKITKNDFLSICQRDRRARDAGEPTPEPHPAHCSRDLLLLHVQTSAPKHLPSGGRHDRLRPTLRAAPCRALLLRVGEVSLVDTWGGAS